MKKTITLTENEIKNAVLSAIREMSEPVSKKRMNPIEKIQAAIDKANQAYKQALEHQGGGDWPLMDRKGNSYGLKGDIRLDGKGYVIIPMDGGQYSEYSPTKIRVLTKAGGKIRIINGDSFEEGWRDVAKILKQIVRDAEIGNGEFTNYDPNWEEGGDKNKDALRDMNKKIGRNANTGMEYLESVIRKRVNRVVNEAFDYWQQAKENVEDFYAEEDENGKTGEPGQVKSYEVGHMYRSNVETEAKEGGYNNVADYLKDWWNEVCSEHIPFIWQTLKPGYGYHGTTIVTIPSQNGGTVVCKEIHEQIMFDEYAPGEFESEQDFENRLNQGEYWTK